MNFLLENNFELKCSPVTNYKANYNSFLFLELLSFIAYSYSIDNVERKCKKLSNLKSTKKMGRQSTNLEASK